MLIKYQSNASRETGFTNGNWYKVVSSYNGMYRVRDDEGYDSVIYQSEIGEVKADES